MMTKFIMATAVGAITALAFNAIANAVNDAKWRSSRAKTVRSYVHREPNEE